uniref:Uncharacterized protein n=1 Tax=Arundo donax TaxID=35708 RepID=A0A0A9CVG6_ARUDO
MIKEPSILAAWHLVAMEEQAGEMGEAAESKKSRGSCSTLHSWMGELSNQNKERETLELSLSLRRGSLKNSVQREGKALYCQQLYALSWLLRRFFPSTRFLPPCSYARKAKAPPQKLQGMPLRPSTMAAPRQGVCFCLRLKSLHEHTPLSV